MTKDQLKISPLASHMRGRTCVTEDPPGTSSKVVPFFDNQAATDFALPFPGDELVYRFLAIVMLHKTAVENQHLHLLGIEP